MGSDRCDGSRRKLGGSAGATAPSCRCGHSRAAPSCGCAELRLRLTQQVTTLLQSRVEPSATPVMLWGSTLIEAVRDHAPMSWKPDSDLLIPAALERKLLTGPEESLEAELYISSESSRFRMDAGGSVTTSSRPVHTDEFLYEFPQKYAVLHPYPDSARKYACTAVAD